METKIFEVRDRNTFVPVLCVQLHALPGERNYYLLRRCGYDLSTFGTNILMTLLDGSNARTNYDPYNWETRTFKVAHQHIIDKWPVLESGDVIDVEFILGETTKPKKSEREEKA